MAIKRDYGGSFRKQLRHFPVWDVGSALALGDFGVVSDNCFTKMGNILDLDVRPEVDTSMSPAEYFEFASSGTTVASGQAQGSAGDVKASLEVHFESAFSLFVRADESRIVSMANAQRVGNQLKGAVGWSKKHCWVSSVRIAKSCIVLMNTRRSSSIKLEADPGVLAHLAAGKVSANAAATIAVTGDAGLRYFGGAGAIYVDLMHLGIFGGIDPMRKGEVDVRTLAPEEDIEDGPGA